MPNIAEHPCVSIIIPTYNRRTLLERAVGSVLGQTYTNWELLIVDDGSSDDTAGYASALMREDARIRFLHNTSHRKGPGAARNVGIAASEGALVAFLDSDDAWLSENLQKKVAFFRRHPEAMALGSDCYVGGTSETNRLSIRYDSIDNSHDAVFRTIVSQKQFWIYTPTVMLRREVFTTIGLFNEALIRCEDLVMWLSINNHWGWQYLPEPLAVINTSEARNDAYSSERIVPEGYYHMLFIRDLSSYISLKPEDWRVLRAQRYAPDYLYWRGREKLDRWDPAGIVYYVGAVISAGLRRLKGRW